MKAVRKIVLGFGLCILGIVGVASCGGGGGGSSSASDYALLESLSVAPSVILSPSFKNDRFEYTANVDNTVAAVSITAVAGHPAQLVVINAETVGSGSAFEADLAVGPNQIRVVVIAENREAQQEYLLTVIRAGDLSNDALLSSLTVAPGTWNQAFVPGDEVYHVAVASNVASVQVQYAAHHSKAMCRETIAGVAGAQRNAGSFTFGDLKTGDNIFSIQVTAEDGVTAKEYTVTVNRAGDPPSNEARIKTLVSSAGTWRTPFSQEGNDFIIDVPSTLEEIELTPSLVSAKASMRATVTIGSDEDNFSTASGSPIELEGLLTGNDNTLKLAVKAEDGKTTKNYTITVCRAGDAQVSTPVISLASGAYDPGTVANFSCATAGAVMHYTLDGSDPDESDPSGTSVALSVEGSYKLRVRAYKSGLLASAISSVKQYSIFAGRRIHFKRPSDWTMTRIYYYNGANSSGWTDAGKPNKVMAQEGSTSWYLHTLTEAWATGTNNPLVIFFGGDDTRRTPAANAAGYSLSANGIGKEGWCYWSADQNKYVWSAENPEGPKKPVVTVTPAGGYFADELDIVVDIQSDSPVLAKTYTIEGQSPKAINGPVEIGDDMEDGDSVLILFSVTNETGTTEKEYRYTKGAEPVITRLGAQYTPAHTTFSIWSPDSADVKVVVAGTEYTCVKVSDFGGYTDVYSVTVSGDLHLKEYQFAIAGKNVRDPYGVMVKYDPKLGVGTDETYVQNAITSGLTSGRVNFWEGPEKVKINGVEVNVVDKGNQYGARITANTGLTVNIVLDMDRLQPSGGWAPVPQLVNREDSIIYEVHVGDFTVSSNSGVPAEMRGKFKGFVYPGATHNAMKTGIDYLKELGVTHVQVLPVYDYCTKLNKAITDTYNWGYDPVNFNVPEDRFSMTPGDYEARVKEFREFVNELHKANIRVIMDVVYNHTYMDEQFENITKKYYDGKNLSGCGNSVNTGEAMVSRFIRDSLEFWVREYNVDGFRFDLLGIFHTDEVRKWGEYLNEKYPNRNLLIYGELWNGFASDDHKVKLFPANRALVSSGKVGGFNADFRELIKGGCDDNTTGFVQNWQDNSKGKSAEKYFYRGIIGSLKENKTIESLYDSANEWWMWNNWSSVDPEQSINYAFAHDNYCAFDKVSLPRPNGTQWDAGYRTAQIKFAHAMVFTAQGLAFLHAGDEMLRTKKLAGETLPYEPVRNTYMWGTERNTLDWSLRSTNATLVNYHRDLIALRKQRAGFRLTTWDDVTNRVKVTLQKDTGLVATVEIDEDNNLGNGYELLVVYNSGNDWTLTWPGWNKIFDGNGFNCAANKVCKGTEMTVFSK